MMTTPDAPLPADLSQLSEEEFLALCPQGEHAPGAEPLSPAAQAVKDAALAMYAGPNVRRLAWPLDMPVVVAAIRAAADHLDAESPWPGHIESTGVNWSRNELHKIATELESCN